MTAQFNAGSIEATLNLNNTPFKRGLDEARAQAEAFSKKRYTATLDLEVKGNPALVGEMDKEVAKLTATSNRATPVLERLGKAAEGGGSSGGGGGLGGLAGVGLGILKFGTLGGIIGGLLPLAGQATAALAGFGAAGAVAGGGLLVGLIPIVKMLGSAFSEITAANKKGKTLGGSLGDLQSSLKGLTKEWNALSKAVDPSLFRVVEGVFSSLDKVIPKLAPVLKDAVAGFAGLGGMLDKLFSSKLFEHFLDTLGPFLKQFGTGFVQVLGDTLKIFMNLFIALQPLIQTLGHGITELFDVLADKSGKLRSSGLGGFMEYIKRDWPQVKLLLSTAGDALGKILSALQPLTGPALTTLTALFKAIGDLDWTSIVAGFTSILSIATTLLPQLSTFINSVLPSLASFLGHLATWVAELAQHQQAFQAVLTGIAAFALVKFTSNQFGAFGAFAGTLLSLSAAYSAGGLKGLLAALPGALLAWATVSGGGGGGGGDSLASKAQDSIKDKLVGKADDAGKFAAGGLLAKLAPGLAGASGTEVAGSAAVGLGTLGALLGPAALIPAAIAASPATLFDQSKFKSSYINGLSPADVTDFGKAQEHQALNQNYLNTKNQTDVMNKYIAALKAAEAATGKNTAEVKKLTIAQAMAQGNPTGSPVGSNNFNGPASGKQLADRAIALGLPDPALTGKSLKEVQAEIDKQLAANKKAADQAKADSQKTHDKLDNVKKSIDDAKDSANSNTKSITDALSRQQAGLQLYLRSMGQGTTP